MKKTTFLKWKAKQNNIGVANLKWWLPMLIQQLFFFPLFSGLTGRCCVCTTLIDTQHVKHQTMNIFVRKRVRGKTRPLLMSQWKVEQSVSRYLILGSHFCCQHHTRDIESQTNLILLHLLNRKWLAEWQISIHDMSDGNILKRHLKFNLRVRTYLSTNRMAFITVPTCPSPCHPSAQQKKNEKKKLNTETHTQKKREGRRSWRGRKKNNSNIFFK